MHISLDSELGRQRRLNQIGEPINTIATPAAAYSLRSLTGGDPKVVRVRRSSDDDEQDFTASEVASGAMLDYVNTQAIKPLDIRELTSGTSDDGRNGDFLIAKAAYSLRSLGTRQATIPNDAAPLNADTVVPASGKYVVQVRRNVDGNIKSFTADEITDGTLASFVNESFTSSLPLDVQGSAAAAYSLRNLSSSYSDEVVEVRRSSNNDTQKFTANEVTDGTLLSFVNEDIITEQSDFTSGVDGYAKDSQGTVSREASFEGKSDVLKYEFASTGRFAIKKTSIALDLTSSYTISFDYYADSEYNGKFWGIEAAFAARASASSNSPTVVSGAWTSVTLNVPSGRATGISTLHIRTQDASDSTYGVTGITANVRFKNIVVTQLTGSGFVKTWYDQAGSNDAVQTDTSKQPKVVNNGNLVTKLGKPSIDFTTTNAVLFSGGFSITEAESSVFAIWQPAKDGADADESKNRALFSNISGQIYIASPNTVNKMSFRRFNAIQTFTLAAASLNTPNLHALVGTSSGANYYFNGSSIYSDTETGTDATRHDLYIGNKQNVTSHDTEGYISELIFYDSDQSENRRALEESIAGHYDGITLGSFSRDGFVRTWYDQSVTTQAGDTATGNHAIQTTAANQPKIVNNGSLVADGSVNALDFEGTSQFFSCSAFGVSGTTSRSIFTTLFRDTNSANNPYLGIGDGITVANGNKWQLTPEPSVLVFGGNEKYVSSVPSAVELFTNIFAGTNVTDNSFFKNGSEVTATASSSKTVNTNETLTNIGKSGAGNELYYDGRMAEFIIYNTDQTANRTAIEANMGSVYGVDLPDGFDPTNDKVNGLVERWYDQSGNNRDSIQSTASFQPIIVDEGVFQDGLKFTHADASDTNNKRLYVPLSQNQLNPFTYVFVGKVTIATASADRNLLGGTRGIQNFPPGTAGISIRANTDASTSGTVLFRNETSTTETIRNISSTTVTVGASAQDFLAFVTFEDNVSGPISELSVNGNKQNFAYESGLTLNSSKNIGIMNATKDNNSATHYTRERSPTGTCREILVYDTFQSANRVALETNIINHYGIS